MSISAGLATSPFHRSRLLLLLSTHLVVALVALVTVGGATRVMEAGLSCPDWPLCYGSVLPMAQMTIRVFLEWFHRVDAALVALGLLAVAMLSWGQRQHLPPAVPVLATTAVLLVAVQVALGALTVTQLLRFDVVTAHLATGLLLVALLSLLRQRLLLALEPLPDNGGCNLDRALALVASRGCPGGLSPMRPGWLAGQPVGHRAMPAPAAGL